MLVMEYLDMGPVQRSNCGDAGGSAAAAVTFSPTIPEGEARNYFRQALTGLDYLHYNKVAHGACALGDGLRASQGEGG